jgi:hypothetical protein
MKLTKRCSGERWRLETSEVGREKRAKAWRGCQLYLFIHRLLLESTEQLLPSTAEHAPPAHPNRDVAPLKLNPFGREEEMVLRQGGNGVETVAWG